jgi:hypothetical protein
LILSAAFVLAGVTAVESTPEQTPVPAPTTYTPPPGSWMARCATAPTADYIAYFHNRHTTPDYWCTLIGNHDPSPNLVYRMDDFHLEGIGITGLAAALALSPADIVGVVPQTPTEEQTHLIALYALIDARIAAAPGGGPTMAEHLALEARVTTAELDLATAEATILTLQADLATVQTALTGMKTALGPF